MTLVLAPLAVGMATFRAAPAAASWLQPLVKRITGAAGGRRARKQAEAQAAQQGAAQAQAANQQAIDTFKKAAGVCLEGRGYTVS